MWTVCSSALRRMPSAADRDLTGSAVDLEGASSPWLIRIVRPSTITLKAIGQRPEGVCRGDGLLVSLLPRPRRRSRGVHDLAARLIPLVLRLDQVAEALDRLVERDARLADLIPAGRLTSRDGLPGRSTWRRT